MARLKIMRAAPDVHAFNLTGLENLGNQAFYWYRKGIHLIAAILFPFTDAQVAHLLLVQGYAEIGQEHSAFAE